MKGLQFKIAVLGPAHEVLVLLEHGFLLENLGMAQSNRIKGFISILDGNGTINGLSKSMIARLIGLQVEWKQGVDESFLTSDVVLQFMDDLTESQKIGLSVLGESLPEGTMSAAGVVPAGKCAVLFSPSATRASRRVASFFSQYIGQNIK